jgi:peptide-methionine (S)-S-oxide reductase
MNKAVFGAGCFWHVEAEFLKLKGVIETSVGFMGGNVENPSYERVCEGDTGHVEVVEVSFDPEIISYEELVRAFFKLHDPTQVNRQGPDIGYQYRSVIFYFTPEQKQIAESIKNELERTMGGIATKIEKASEYYRAEEYHQKYYQKNGLTSCRI